MKGLFHFNDITEGQKAAFEVICRRKRRWNIRKNTHQEPNLEFFSFRKLCNDSVDEKPQPFNNAPTGKFNDIG